MTATWVWQVLLTVYSSKDLEFGSTENTFLSDIYREGSLVLGKVRSRLIRNNLRFSRPLLSLYLAREDAPLIEHLFEVEIRASLEDISGKEVGKILMPTAYVIGSETRSLGPSWSESIIKLEPLSVCQMSHLGNRLEHRDANITFFITDNPHVGPLDQIERCFTGIVRNKRTPTITVDFGNNWTGKFWKNYEYERAEISAIQGWFTTGRQTFELERKSHQIESVDEVMQISERIRNLFWYLSFATRRRTVWTEWTARIDNDLVRYCQGNVSIPRKEDARNDRPLIERVQLQDFLRRCMEYMTDSKSPNILLPLIYLVNAVPPKTVESQFLSAYAAFESLMTLYARGKGIEKHFNDKSRWKALYEYMEKCIDNYGDIDGDLRRILKGKLGLFNDASPRIFFEDFCVTKELDTSDLWPLFSGTRSLSRIRNKLIHGEEIVGEFLDVATENLKWIVERCILSTIGWNKPSDVDSKSLREYTCYELWRSYYR